MHPKVGAALAGEIGGVYLVLGARVLGARALDALDAAAKPLCEPASFNRTRWRCGDGDGRAALGALQTVPMMASRRLVRVDALEDGTDAFFDGLLGYLASPSPTTILLLGGEKFPKVVKGGRAWATLIPKAVEKVGRVIKFGDEDAEPTRFVMEELRALGASIDGSAARLVVELVGTDLSRLLREVEKLALAVPAGGEVDAEVVAAHCASVAEPAVWGLTQGIASRRADEALGALHRLLDDGEAPHKLLALVLWQLRQVLRLAEMIRQGRSDEEMRSSLKLRSDLFYSLRRELERAPPGAAALLAQVARANRAMNRVRAGDDRVFELLVLELCQRG